MKRELSDPELDRLLEQLARQKGLYPSITDDQEIGEEREGAADRQESSRTKKARSLFASLAAIGLLCIAARFYFQSQPSPPPELVSRDREAGLQSDTSNGDPSPIDPFSPSQPSKPLRSTERSRPSEQARPPVTEEKGSATSASKPTPWYVEAKAHLDDFRSPAEAPPSESWRKDILIAIASSTSPRRDQILLRALQDPSPVIGRQTANKLNVTTDPRISDQLLVLELPSNDNSTRMILFRTPVVQSMIEVPRFVAKLLEEGLPALPPSEATSVIAYCLNRGLSPPDVEARLLAFLVAALDKNTARNALHEILTIDKSRFSPGKKIQDFIQALLPSTEASIRRSSFRIYLRWFGFDDEIVEHARQDLLGRKAVLEALYLEARHVQREAVSEVRSFCLASLSERDLHPFVFPLLLRFPGAESIVPLRALLEEGTLRPGERDRIRLTMLAIDGTTFSPNELDNLSLQSTDPNELAMVLEDLQRLPDENLFRIPFLPEELLRILSRETHEGCVLGAMRLLHRFGRTNSELERQFLAQLSRFTTSPRWFLRFAAAVFRSSSRVGNSDDRNSLSILVDSLGTSNRSPIVMAHLRERIPQLYDEVRTNTLRIESLTKKTLDSFTEMISDLELASFRTTLSH